jgi:hypothetical protein
MGQPTTHHDHTNNSSRKHSNTTTTASTRHDEQQTTNSISNKNVDIKRTSSHPTPRIGTSEWDTHPHAHFKTPQGLLKAYHHFRQQVATFIAHFAT